MRRINIASQTSGTTRATVYPDSDKVAIWTGNGTDDLITTRSSSVDYWFGEADSGATRRLPSGPEEASDEFDAAARSHQVTPQPTIVRS
jgi:hypothetical protein